MPLAPLEGVFWLVVNPSSQVLKSIASCDTTHSLPNAQNHFGIGGTKSRRVELSRYLETPISRDTDMIKDVIADQCSKMMWVSRCWVDLVTIPEHRFGMQLCW